MLSEGAKHHVEMPWPPPNNTSVSLHRSCRAHRKLAGMVLCGQFAAERLKRLSDRYHLTGTDLATSVRYPSCKAYYTPKLVQCRQRYKKAEGRPLTETHNDDTTRVGAAMNFSLDPCFHTGDRGRYRDLVPFIVGRRK